MTADVRGFGPIDSARSTALAVSSPFRDFVGTAVSPIADTWNGAVHYDELEAENAQLRLEVAQLEGDVARLPDIESDLDELLAATGFDVAGDLGRVTARVISDRQTGIERVIEINRGSADGLVVGMPVVVGAGLAGRVDDVFADHRSTVLLITDSRVRVGLNGVDSGVSAITTGKGRNDQLEVEFQAIDLESVQGGERFETNGFSELYPPDIPVGSLVVADDGSVFLIPFVDFDKLGFVTIILTEVTP